MRDPRVEALVSALHQSPHKLVYEFCGAGSLALYWLHSVAGSSRTVLEASDRYAKESLCDLLGEEPEKFVSREAAQMMARKAYLRAQRLSLGPCLGLSCTAAIATDRQRKGEDQCFISLEGDGQRSSYHLILTRGTRDRLGQEAVVSQLVLYALAEACQLAISAPLDLLTGEAVSRG